MAAPPAAGEGAQPKPKVSEESEMDKVFLDPEQSCRYSKQVAAMLRRYSFSSKKPKEPIEVPNMEKLIKPKREIEELKKTVAEVIDQMKADRGKLRVSHVDPRRCMQAGQQQPAWCAVHRTCTEHSAHSLHTTL